MNKIPAGLVDHNYEFFVSPNVALSAITGGSVKSFDDLGDDVLQVIEKQMRRYPAKLREIGKMGIIGTRDVIKQFLICNYGGFDHHADMVEDQLMPTEYWPCPLRGSCAHEGILCDKFKTDTGEYLNKREMQVLKLIAAGSLDKEIAEQLTISIHTVTTYTQNIRRKTGLLRKPDLTLYAHQKNLA
jgi:DNA-binding CsgD family transcriptional regulator